VSDRLETLHKELAAGVAALVTSDDWLAWLKVAAKFRRYSFNNQMLILLQCPEATHVAGFRAWQEMGRQVRKGEKSLGIFAPSTRKVRDETTGEESRRVVGYRVVSVFDVSQTDGDPLPEPVRPVLLDGEAPAGLWDALAALVTGDGYALERGDCGQANGWTKADPPTVRVRDDVSDAQAAKTLAHELAHVRLHMAPDYNYGQHRGLAEVEAESVAYLVAAAHGLPTGGYSLPYVAGWGEDAAVVTATASRVIATARAILAVTDAEAVTVAA